MSAVHVIGAGMTQFKPHPTVEVHELARQAAWAAIESSGVRPEDIELAYAGHAYQGQCFGQKVLLKIGMTGMPVVNCENACASGASAVWGVVNAIKAGQADIGIAIGAEKLASAKGGFTPLVADDLESSMGRVMPSVFSMMARKHMDRYGTTLDQLARIAVKNRRGGVRNPYSPWRDEITVEDVLAAPMIAEPLTRLSCCPVSDGAAAVILASDRVARRYTARPVEVRAAILASGIRNGVGMADDHSEMTIRAARRAYEVAGIGPEDVDLCELHDPFTIAELVHYEDLGFCAPGEGGRGVDEGWFDIGGRVAVSPSGGLLARGHPLGATGVAQIAEMFWQLRGEAGERQVPGARVGLAHTVGGGVTQIEAGATSVHILVG
ncbi:MULTISPECIES: thiolase family protein [Xanthobacter]|uniref:thiolase family protein n=1 Tax=Xanthobacter TaxID=279 RepID=UPI002022C5E8|nr:thiolase family protein [Xanthobacter aminoxidans]MCL8383562.1 thiolase family protein [Xanthobacter aminoxidans]